VHVRVCACVSVYYHVTHHKSHENTLTPGTTWMFCF